MIVTVVRSEHKNGKPGTSFLVSIKYTSQLTGRTRTKTFAYRTYPTERFKLVNEDVLSRVAMQIFDDSLVERLKPRSLYGMMSRHITAISRRKNPLFAPVVSAMSGIEDPKAVKNLEMPAAAKAVKSAKLPLIHNLLKQEPNTATTTLMLAPSFQGKTHLLVKSLNELVDTGNIKNIDFIVLFTESTSAEPLKKLHLPADKFVLLGKYCPGVIKALVKINKVTGNAFRFLVCMDDIVSLRGNMFTKLFLTLRNAGISTVLLTQHSRLVTPAMRMSAHRIVLFNLRVPEWTSMIKDFLLTHLRDISMSAFGKDFSKLKPEPLAQAVKDSMDDKILIYDQRHDKLDVFRKYE